jgi:peptidoglycan/LPS O-acetylase OafA/YrhL
MLKDVSVKGVVIGLVVDIGGTFLFFFVFAVLGAILLASTGRDIDELKDVAETPTFIVVSSIAGLLFSALGGYVSARIARKAEVRNALATGALSVLVGLVLFVGTPASPRSWLDLLSLILIIPFAMIGGYACLRSKQGSPESERL